MNVLKMELLYYLMLEEYSFDNHINPQEVVMDWKLLGYNNHKRKQIPEYSYVFDLEISHCLIIEGKGSDTSNKTRRREVSLPVTKI